jgi:membrane-bound serine protease (ClpP class)
VPELQLSLRLVLPIVVGVGGIAILLARLAVVSQRPLAVTGVAGMVGEAGRALTAMDRDRTGRVVTHGEIWRAIAPEPIAEGDLVCVTSVDGLTLTVRKA